MPVTATIIRPNLPFGCESTYLLNTTNGDDRKQIFEELSKYLNFRVSSEFTDEVTESMPEKGGRLNKMFPTLKFERENSYFYDGVLENNYEYSKNLKNLCEIYTKNNCNIVKNKYMMLIMRQMNKNNWTVLYF
tara:strand:- start:8043 stop:8441 length:399 start_codon:yes stop_codon:yes gene_type:complete